MSQSTYSYLGLPDEIPITLFLVTLILALVPYLGGVDLGIFKIPELTRRSRRYAFVAGPILVVAVICGFFPVWPKPNDIPRPETKPVAYKPDESKSAKREGPRPTEPKEVVIQEASNRIKERVAEWGCSAVLTDESPLSGVGKPEARLYVNLQPAREQVTEKIKTLMPDLQKLPQVSLTLWDTDIDDDGLEFIAKNLNAQLVGLLHQVSVPMASWPYRLYTQKGLDALRACSNLQGLQVYAQNLKFIEGMTKLRVLKILTNRTQGPGITNDDLNYIRSKRLEILWLSDCGELTSLGNLEHSEKLAYLLVTNTGIGDESLEVVGNFTKLSTLILAQNSAITDEGVAQLAGLRELVHLVLSDMQITDKGLEHVAQLSKLRTLSLSGTSVTKDGLKHLGELELDRLTLAVGLKNQDQAIKQELPKVKTIEYR